MALARPSVRKATRDDEAAVVRALVRAFDDDPVTRFLLRTTDYPGALALVFGAYFRRMSLPDGMAWIADDGGGAALWSPPGHTDPSLFDALLMSSPFVRAAGAARLFRSTRALRTLLSVHPKEPHHYLFAIGVDPDKQGRGIGSALLEVNQSTPAYLEASTDSSARLYARHGFQVLRELRLVPEAPPIWPMWRD
jgi:ribosomal protein S18 acetylase RimI-like enzyme